MGQKSIKNHQKMIQNRQKSRFGGVPGGLGAPRAAPKAPETKKVTKSSLNPRSFPPFGVPKIIDFRFFCDFCWLFCGRFSEACFGGLRPLILEDFGMFFDRFLTFFVKRGASRGDAKNVVLYWYLQCLVAIGLSKKQNSIIFPIGGCFSRGLSAPLLIDFCRFWIPF